LLRLRQCWKILTSNDELIIAFQRLPIPLRQIRSRFVGALAESINASCSEPKRRRCENAKAWGNAPGYGAVIESSAEGAKLCRPFRARLNFVDVIQGVAPGYFISRFQREEGVAYCERNRLLVRSFGFVECADGFQFFLGFEQFRVAIDVQKDRGLSAARIDNELFTVRAHGAQYNKWIGKLII
jgi:hypothetical protein